MLIEVAQEVARLHPVRSEKVTFPGGLLVTLLPELKVTP